MDSSSDSEDSAVGSRGLEWEVLSSHEGNFSDSNNGQDGEVHEQGVALHSQHFVCPSEPEVRDSEQKDEETGSRKGVRDWVEPSASQAEAGGDKDLDLDMLSSLVSSVMESGGEKKETQTQGEEIASAQAHESLASLQREILSESGFSSLVPSDVHGNVVKPGDEGSASAVTEEDAVAEDGGEGLLSCWRRKAKVLGDYIRQAGTLWSLTLATALMGLIVLGRQWQQERWLNQQLRLQLCYKDEKISQLLFQIARLKQAVSGRRRIPVLRSSPK